MKLEASFLCKFYRGVVVMRFNRPFKMFVSLIIISIFILSLAACSNRDIAVTALTVEDSNNSTSSNSSGSNEKVTGASTQLEPEQDIVALSKEHAAAVVKERAAKVLAASALEDQIKAYLGNNLNNVGLSYYDINSEQKIEINGDKTFLAASTVKVQMNMVLGDMIQNGTVDGNESLTFTQDCYEGGTGILQGQDLSKSLPLSVLANDSIIYSDNIATNMIIKRIDYDNMRNLIDAKLGHATDHSDNLVNASDETALLKQLYLNSENNPSYTKLIENMKNTDFHDRLDLYLPHNLVAHKIGNYGDYVNDVGIIYTQNPYILSIYTNGVGNANEIIAHISKMIYDFQNSQ